MNKLFSFFAKSNRYKHLIGGFLVALLAGAPWTAIYAAIVAASCLELKDRLYAPIHNWGGTLHPTVTPKMRRFAWAMFYRTAGIKRGASPKSRKNSKSASRSDSSSGKAENSKTAYANEQNRKSSKS